VNQAGLAGFFDFDKRTEVGHACDLALYNSTGINSHSFFPPELSFLTWAETGYERGSHT
jgi:hypothetical protein